MQGYFGKGILSRSRPVFSISDPLLVAKWQGKCPLMAPVTCPRCVRSGLSLPVSCAEGVPGKAVSSLLSAFPCPHWGVPWKSVRRGILGLQRTLWFFLGLICVNTDMPIITSHKYQRRVQWARSVLQEQGLDDSSVTQILESYTKPLELEECGAEGAGGGCKRTGPNTEGTALCREPCPEPGGAGAQSPEEHPGGPRKACLGGEAGLGPMCASEELQQGGPKEGEGSCQGCGAAGHCGCQGKQSPQQRAWQGLESREDAPEYLLVQEEEEGSSCPEDDSAHAHGKLVKKEKLVCRKNPFRIFEYLQLSLEEAFFLVYALGCLSIYYGEEPLPILKLWEVFTEVKPDFRTTYMAYHYFRSRGWVPKVGLKYGTDLLLYRKGPPFYHASYSVLAELVDEDFQGPLRRPLSWMCLSGLNRTTANASKELMLCYLIKPSDMTAEEMASPECMKRIKVQELIVSRWVSSRERSEQEEF
ncbi:tRNA-splicing endonuclease subunit Sen2 isoform X2 [Pithys albifrons albifrons]|uniref:tRNA-splicing endonuclease subunit Sen2 isoform X2 n=1 Tax=Pithys albifrons albifrons TaxID=3385563 RepID=UPI003A5CFD21